MLKFTKHSGIVMPLDISNIDTDIIIPKQFLKSIDKIGLGKYLFFNWRYSNNSSKTLNNQFILNNPFYKNASVLLTRENFGCGSSREHAVWSLWDYGFRVIIAPSFADIFYNNSFNNGLLLLTLDDLKITSLFKMLKKSVSSMCTIDLIQKNIFINNLSFPFEIDEVRRMSLLNGFDNIDSTMKFLDKIKNYEDNLPDFLFKRKIFSV